MYTKVEQDIGRQIVAPGDEAEIKYLGSMSLGSSLSNLAAVWSSCMVLGAVGSKRGARRISRYYGYQLFCRTSFPPLGSSYTVTTS